MDPAAGRWCALETPSASGWVIRPRHARVERVAQPVAEHVHRQHRHGQERGRVQDVVRQDLEHAAALGHDVAPGGRFRRDAHAQEGQRGLEQDGRAGDEGGLHDQRRDGVGQHVPPQHLEGRRADRDGGFDIGLLADRQHDRSHQPHHARYFGDGDGDDHCQQAGARQRHQRDRDQDRRHRHQPVHDAHDDAVERTEVARRQPDGQADGHRHHRHRQARR